MLWSILFSIAQTAILAWLLVFLVPAR